MKNNALGIVLSFYRKKYDFSQLPLCDGICSVATLSRIEAMNNEADSLTGECLLGRLGKELRSFELILNDEDYQIWQIRKDIIKCMENRDYDEAETLLENYREITKTNNPVHEQFYLMYMVKLKIKQNASPAELCELLFKALVITKPDFNPDNECELLYNPTEIELILLLIKYEYEEWNDKTRKKLLLRMLDYVKKIYSDKRSETTQMKILDTLIEEYIKIEDDIKVLKYVDEAIKISAQSKGMNNIGELHFIKARAIEHYFSEKNAWENERKRCMEECLMAYSVFRIMNNEQETEKLTKFCKEKLNWQITELGI